MLSPVRIITLSHLRWDFVYQRPQHVLARLAARHPVIFIEEPVFTPPSDGVQQPKWHFSKPAPNVLVCRPHTPSPAPGFCEEQMPYLKTLMQELVRQEDLNEYVLWFYTPMALPLAANLKPSAVVYDCMDELSAFLNAPPKLREREKQLLAQAD